MPSFSNDIDIDVDEFMDELSTSEISEVIDWLKDNNWLDNNEKPLDENKLNFDEELFIKNLTKLKSNLLSLNKEVFEIINKIASRF
jgi:hypothetical protein